MAVNGTKFRILYLYQILVRYSDADHPISTVELTQMLKEKYNMDVNRNTLANDLDILRESGLHIEVIRSTQNRYYYDGRIFDVPELKLLVDAVSSSKFITERKSEQLIGKLLTLTNIDNAAKLRRHIYISGRVKSDNEKGYYIVDAINDAIDLKRKISFLYTDYNGDKQRIIKHDGNPYIVSPYALIWDGDYYYVIGHCDSHDKIQTFRLDRIERQPEILEEIIEPAPDEFNLAQYNKTVFRMYDTDEPVAVKLLCENHVMKAIIDSFGLNVDTMKVDDDHFLANVTVCASPTFYCWIFGWCGAVKIQEPMSVKDEYKKMLKQALKE
ncbi:MAG: WYL domain-containing protein [Lachnospiraceae bacterium]|nr:WYL domain-containing protein [Lachnospiraceae bacterium]